MDGAAASDICAGRYFSNKCRDWGKNWFKQMMVSIDGSETQFQFPIGSVHSEKVMFYDIEGLDAANRGILSSFC